MNLNVRDNLTAEKQSIDNQSINIESPIKNSEEIESEDNLSDASECSGIDRKRKFSDSDVESTSDTSCASLDSGGSSWKYNRKCNKCGKIRIPCRVDPDRLFSGTCWDEFACYRKESRPCPASGDEEDSEVLEEENDSDIDKEETDGNKKECDRKGNFDPSESMKQKFEFITKPLDKDGKEVSKANPAKIKRDE